MFEHRTNNRDFFEVYAQTLKNYNLKKHKTQNKENKFKKIFILFFIISAILTSALFGIYFYVFSQVNVNSNFEKTCETLGVASMQKIDEKIVNIAIFGVDKRQEDHYGRSDATMIVSLDGIHNKIKLTNILRDSRVKIENHGYEKICHAFSYGGPELAVKTINQNFNLDIHDYIKVDFVQMANLVDVLGGLDLEISRQEVFAINGLMNSTPEFVKLKRVPNLSKNVQTIHLTGAQVLNYTRIRKLDSDIKRAERQQYVLNAIFSKIKNMSKTQYPDFFRKIIKLVETSFSPTQILSLIPLLISVSNEINTFKIPNPEGKGVKSNVIDGAWVWTFDLKDYANQLHSFIYEE